MPIALAPENIELKVVRIMVDDKIKKHLESLGITINSKITVINKQAGNTVCIVKNERLALDRNISTKIFVA